ncbi:MAG: endonuclease [archaeon]|nr:endonuclease [archaeon]
MKKSILFTLLPLVSACLVACGETPEPKEPEKDPTEIVGISIDGDLTKKEYEYDDEWDFSGLVINAVQRNDEKIKLKQSEYTLTKTCAAPKNLGAGLSLTVKYNKKKTITNSRVFKDIFVKDEPYNEAEEKEEYYDGYNLELTGTKLLNELHKNSFDKHTYFVKYGETNAYLRKQKNFDSPDVIPGKHNTEYFYTGKESNYDSGTREHVWACNDSAGLWPHGTVDESSYIGGGSDLYHIRPSDTEVNTARGDAPFIDFDDFSYSPVIKVGDDGPYKLKCYKKGYKSGTTLEFADYVEVDDHFKGDVARTVAYLYMHYHTNSNTPSDKKSLTGGLQLTSVLGYSTESRCIEILKKWNNLDKPSEVEKYRNHVVQQIQGNRNPFVDDYTLLNKMFE